MAMPLISKYSESFVVSQITIVIIAPTKICNGNKMKGFNGMKLMAKTGTAIATATPKLGRMSFTCSLMLYFKKGPE